MKKLLTCLLLTLCLVLGCAAPGCSHKEEPTPATTRASGDIANLNMPGQLPVVRAGDTLRVYITRNALVSSYEYGTNTFTTWLQDRTGVHVEFLYPAGDPEADLRLRLASRGDAGDLILYQMGFGRLTGYGAAGMILPLNGLIETYGYHLKDLMTTFPETLPAITSPDSSIYAFPQGNVTGLSLGTYGMKLWIHKGYLARYGRGIPSTTDELREYFRWVRDADADGDGEIEDEVPWTGSESRTAGYARPTDFIMNAFTLQDENGFYVRDGTLRCAMVEENYRVGLRYLRGLMEEELLDINYATNDLYGIRSLMALEEGDNVGSISCGNVGIATSDPEIMAKFEAVPPLAGPDGLVYAFHDQYAAGMAPGKAFIPANSSRKELAAAWMDACYAQEVAMRAEHGAEGVDWKIPSPGTVAADGGPATYELLRYEAAQETSSTWLTDSPALWNRVGVAGIAARPAGAYDLIAELVRATRLYEPYVRLCAVPPLYVDPEVSPTYDDKEFSIEMETSNARAEFIYGIRDIASDKDWASYLQQVSDAGLEDYLKIRQAIYDRSWKELAPSAYIPKPTRIT